MVEMGRVEMVELERIVMVGIGIMEKAEIERMEVVELWNTETVGTGRVERRCGELSGGEEGVWRIFALALWYRYLGGRKL